LAAAASPLGVEGVRVDVVDHWIGIRQEDLEVIFEEFRQVDGSASRRHEGSGLGLALVRKLLPSDSRLLAVIASRPIMAPAIALRRIRTAKTRRARRGSARKELFALSLRP
jgi:K+-sensing histidine kinase KdpD